MIYLKIINGSFGNFVILYLKDFKKIVIVKINIVFLVIEIVKLKIWRIINKIRKENLFFKMKRYMLRKYFFSE